MGLRQAYRFSQNSNPEYSTPLSDAELYNLESAYNLKHPVSAARSHQKHNNQRECFILRLTTLNRPEWLKVYCEKDILRSFVCWKSKNISSNHSVNKTMVSQSQFCQYGEILLQNSCLWFLHYEGKTRNSKTEAMTVGSMSLSNSSVEYLLQTMYKAVGDAFPTLLSFILWRKKTTRVINIFSNLHDIHTKSYLSNSLDVEGHFVFENEKTKTKASETSFRCTRGQSISILLVCNMKQDCDAQESGLSPDEGHCKCKSPTPTKMCSEFCINGTCSCSPWFFKSKEKCISFSEIRLQSISMQRSEKAFGSLRLLVSRHVLNNCSDKHQIPCQYGDNQCYSISDICIYRLDHFNAIIPCNSALHMQECGQFQCNKEFKCPKYYCIPWSYVCDGKHDCPLGADEFKMNCRGNMFCQKMFHCSHSTRCIHMEDICNEFVDCPLSDDEYLCVLKLASCPSSCECFQLAVSCTAKNLELTDLVKYPFVSCHLHSIKVRSLLPLEPKEVPTVVITMFNNSISSFCQELQTVKSFRTLALFDLQSNEVLEISSLCFSNFSKLAAIGMKNNSVQNIEEKAFHNLVNLVLIDLSHNIITHLNKNTFNLIPKKFAILLYNNPLHIVHVGTFCQSTPYLTVSSNDWPLLACLFSTETKAFEGNTKSNCSALLPKPAVQITMMAFTVGIFVLHSVSLFFFTNDKDTKQQATNVFNKFVVTCSVVDILFGAYFAQLLGINTHYKELFTLSFYTWINSGLCVFLCFLVFFYCLLSPQILSLTALARLRVVINPLTSRFKCNAFVVKILIGVVLATTALCAFPVVSTTLSHRLRNPLCFPYIVSSIMWPNIATSAFIAVVHTGALIWIITSYILLIAELSQPNEMESTKKNKLTSSMLIQIIVLIVANLLSWIPLGIICLSSHFITSSPHEIQTWAVTLCLPVNCIMNPAAFGFNSIKRYVMGSLQ